MKGGCVRPQAAAYLPRESLRPRPSVWAAGCATAAVAGFRTAGRTRILHCAAGSTHRPGRLRAAASELVRVASRCAAGESSNRTHRGGPCDRARSGCTRRLAGNRLLPAARLAEKILVRIRRRAARRMGPGSRGTAAAHTGVVRVRQHSEQRRRGQCAADAGPAGGATLTVCVTSPACMCTAGPPVKPRTSRHP